MEIGPDDWPEEISKAGRTRLETGRAFMPRLQHLAWNMLHKHNMQNHEGVVVCIEVDSRHKEIARAVAPGQEPEWQKIRKQGDNPFAMSVVNNVFLDWLVKEFPDLEAVIRQRPEEGVVKGIVVDDDGCVIFDIQPALDHSLMN